MTAQILGRLAALAGEVQVAQLPEMLAAQAHQAKETLAVMVRLLATFMVLVVVALVLRV
jgi:hypothetical protein